MTSPSIACLFLLFIGVVLAQKNVIQSFNDTNYQELMHEKRAVVLCFHPWDSIADDVMHVLPAVVDHFSEDVASSELVVGTLDIHNNPNITRAFNLGISPIFLFLKNGSVVWELRSTMNVEQVITIVERFAKKNTISFLADKNDQNLDNWSSAIQKHEFTVFGFFNLNFDNMSQDDNYSRNALIVNDYEDIYDAFIMISQTLRYDYAFAVLSNNATSEHFNENEEPDQMRLLYLLVESFVNQTNITNKQEILEYLSAKNDPRGFLVLYSRERHAFIVPPVIVPNIMLADWIVKVGRPLALELKSTNFQSLMKEGTPVVIMFVDFTQENATKALETYKSGVYPFYNQGFVFTYMNQTRFYELYRRTFSGNEILPITVIDPEKQTSIRCIGCVDADTVTEFLKQYSNATNDILTPMLQRVFQNTPVKYDGEQLVQPVSHDDLHKLLTECNNKDLANNTILLSYSSLAAMSPPARHTVFKFAREFVGRNDIKFLEIDVAWNDLPESLSSIITKVPTISLLVQDGSCGELRYERSYHGPYHVLTKKRLNKWLLEKNKKHKKRKEMRFPVPDLNLEEQSHIPALTQQQTAIDINNLPEDLRKIVEEMIANSKDKVKIGDKPKVIYMNDVNNDENQFPFSQMNPGGNDQINP